MIATDTKYTVRIEADQDCESPAAMDCNWRPYSFNRRHVNFREPAEFFGDNGKPKLWLRNKLRVGLAFILSYHEHGLGLWFIRGSKYTPDAEWDTADVAGVAVWEDDPGDIGGKTVEDRQKDCASFLEEYTDWCNGNCHGYVIEKANPCDSCGHDEGKEIDSCWGFIGDYIAEAVQEALPDDATEANTEFTGEGAYLCQGIFKKKIA
jgi:hypothetical protein